ncbi:outer membrane protein assembly factor BamB family protein [Alienimonas californiensis]|uniref:Outer membrane biogenesis protein BamB n=1 Tax=Alienimonas californiensis TaxID=2527989 RepID=A0A517PFR8_9PLAN|nr:PQQ-binding-like beta-propeller repeat protein [Alienimonas californiensis]QDT18237.1 outer membrane biogenesis protein BamB [Alienimonas californiensis]
MFAAPLLIAALSFAPAEPANAAETGPAAWPAFLGQGATALDPDAIPLKWTPESPQWTVDLPGHGQSSPVVWGDRAFVTAVSGREKEALHVLGVDLNSGNKLWHRTTGSTDPVENTLYVSRAAPTPCVDGDAVYPFFESGDLYALDHDGEFLWHVSLWKKVGRFQNEFGLGSSPCQTADTLFILKDDPDGPSALIAVRKADGGILWTADRGENRKSWASPAIVPVNGQPHVVVSSGGGVQGYDPATGKELWTLGEVGGNTAVTPVPYFTEDGGDGRFLIGASPGRGGEDVDAARISNGAVRVTAEGDGFKAEKIWTDEDLTVSWASPIVHDGRAYWVNRQGVLFCLNAETGEQLYASRTPAGSCWATPLAVGDRLYLFGKDGVTATVAAGDEYKLLAESRVWEEGATEANGDLAPETDPQRAGASAMFSGITQYGVAADPGGLLIRTGAKLYRLSAE